MIIREEMIRILREFCGINESIVFYPGNVIRTVSNEKDVMAEYQLSEGKFEETIPIYDLTRFMNTVKILGDNPDMQVDGEMIRISSGTQTIDYAMSPENTIIAMDHKMPEFDPVLTFHIQQDQLRKVRQAASALGVQHLSIINNGSSITLKVHQIATDTSNPTDDCFEFTFENTASESSAGSVFVFDINSLPSYDGDYYVALSDNVVSRFVNKNTNLVYWIAMRDETKVV